MSELSQPADFDPFSPDYWEEIDWAVRQRPQGPEPVNMKKNIAPRLVRGFNMIEDGRSRRPDKIFLPGEVFDPSEYPEDTIVAFEREYYLSAGDPSVHQAQAMLEEMSVTQMSLAGSTTSHTAGGYFDAGTGLHWKMRHEVQRGVGVLLRPITAMSLYGVREIRRPAHSLQYRQQIRALAPLGMPKSPTEIKTTYEYINFQAPVNALCRIGVSNEAPVYGNQINPCQRRIERFNSVQAWGSI